MAGQAGDPVAGAVHTQVPAARREGEERNRAVCPRRSNRAQPAATALIRSGDLEDRATFFRNDLAFALESALARTAYLHDQHRGTAPVAAAAIGAQTQIAVFFVSDGALIIDPDGPGALFEVPIVGALPEDLGSFRKLQFGWVRE